MNKLSNLANGEISFDWEVPPLGEVIKPSRPRVKPNEKPNLSFIGMDHIEAHTMKLLGTVPATTMKSSAVHFMPGDVLYGRLRPYLNKVYCPNFEGLCSAEFIVFPKSEKIYNHYLKYFLNSSAFVSFATSLNTGDRPRVKFEQLASYKFPLPPFQVQERIVEEIEKQFSRLDEAVENLNRVKANLKRYKASVLKAAVEGKLTEEWRKSNPDVEPADKLLERILIERRKKWEESELAKMKAKGKIPKDDKWKKKYIEPQKVDIKEFSALPNKWCWVKSDQLFFFVTSGSRGWAKYYSESGAIFLRIGNLDHDSISLDMRKIQYVTPPKGAEGTRTKVTKNDILISITADVGMIGIVPENFREGYINQHISLARPVNAINPIFIAWFLTSRQGQNQFQALQRGATKTGLGLDDIRSVNIPMPPFREQTEIISQVENQLSVVDKIEAELENKLKHADRLRQSILKKAFSGQLVRN